MGTGLVTLDGRPIAGWLLKADPAIYDLEAMFDLYGEIDNWSVHPTYRIHQMDAGQRCFLYVGKGGSYAQGAIVAAGEVTGPAYLDEGGTDGLWIEGGYGARWFVPVALHRLATPVRRGDLSADPRLSSLELLRVPQMSNPTVIRPDELVALDEFDLSVVVPTDEQRARLETRRTIELDDDELVDGDYDELEEQSLTLYAADRDWWVEGVRAKDDPGPHTKWWVIETEIDELDGDGDTLSRIGPFESFEVALASLLDRALQSDGEGMPTGEDEPDEVTLCASYSCADDYSDLVRLTNDKFCRYADLENAVMDGLDEPAEIWGDLRTAVLEAVPA